MVTQAEKIKQRIHIFDFDNTSAVEIKKGLADFPISAEITLSTGAVVEESLIDTKRDLLILCFPLKETESFSTMFETYLPQFASVSQTLFITSNKRDDVRQLAFKHGAGQVLVRPFLNSELYHTVERLLHSTQTFYDAITTDEAMVHFLSEMVTSETMEIIPGLDPLSRYGHFFPDVANIFSKTDRDMDFLEKLAQADLLTRKIHNRVRMCPFCDDNHINIREVCPKCGSIDILQKQTIHHFACGYVDEVDAFKKGADLICPKCSETLRHIGLDYEKPVTHFKCSDCGNIFTEPRVEFQCQLCGLVLNVDDSIEKIVYRYGITPLGEEAARTGSIRGLDLVSLLYNKHTKLYSKQYFDIELKREITRQKRYHQTFTFLMIKIEGLEDIRKRTPGQFEGYVSDVFKAINSHLRELDTTCVWDTELLAVILPGTDIHGASVVVERMNKKIEALEHLFSIRKPEISVSMLPADEKFTTPQDFIGNAISELDSEQ